MSSNDNIRDGFDDLLGDINKKLSEKNTSESTAEKQEPTSSDDFLLDIDSFDDMDDEDISIDVPEKSSSVNPKKASEQNNNTDSNSSQGTRLFDTVKQEKKPDVKASSGNKASVKNENKQAVKKSSDAKLFSLDAKKKQENSKNKTLPNSKNPPQIRKAPAEKPIKNNVPEKAAKRKNTKKRKKSTGLFGGIARFVIYICFIAIASIVCSYIIISVTNDMFAFSKDDSVITVEIPENATTKDISKILSKNDIISNPTVFKFYTNFKKDGSKYYTDGFKSGSFELSPSMNYDDLIFALSNSVGTREVVRLTFPEGSTIDEMIDILIKGGVQNTREEYIDVIQNFDYNYRFINELDTENFKNGRKYRLEGYLFPDTYDFYTDASAVDVINKFLVNFDNKFDPTFYDAAKDHGLTVDEIINIASLIEKEARKAADFGNVSSVFHNRIKNKANYPYLQSDATIQYAFPERKSQITPEDLKYDSPYNTYIYVGLPPSAIANPGLDAITAALYPEDTSYYYFISNSVGVTYFAKTLPEHNMNVAKVRKESES